MITATIKRLSDGRTLKIYAMDYGDVVEQMAEDYGSDWHQHYCIASVAQGII